MSNKINFANIDFANSTLQGSSGGSGGSGGSTLSVLKNFLDSCNVYKYVYDDEVVIGIKMPAYVNKESADLRAEYAASWPSLADKVRCISFDIETGIFCTAILTSGPVDTIKDYILVPMQLSTWSNSKTTLLYTLDTTSLATAIDTLYNNCRNKDKCSLVYYKDLK